MSDENKDRLPDSELSGEDLNRAIRTGEEFSQWLKGIAGDLWSSDGIIPSRPLKPAGAPAGSRTPERPAARPAPNASSAAPAPQKSAGKPVQGKEKEEQKAEREPLNRLWRTADETIDWTDALAMDRPTDGLTPQREWDFYHRMAGRVLEGEINAYIEVLQTINPLGDLRDYVNGMVIRTPGSDRLECSFECRPEEMREDPGLYLGSLAVRIARDLLANPSGQRGVCGGKPRRAALPGRDLPPGASAAEASDLPGSFRLCQGMRRNPGNGDRPGVEKRVINPAARIFNHQPPGCPMSRPHQGSQAREGNRHPRKENPD